MQSITPAKVTGTQRIGDKVVYSFKQQWLKLAVYYYVR
jgi:hypothetical protein